MVERSDRSTKVGVVARRQRALIGQQSEDAELPIEQRDGGLVACVLPPFPRHALRLVRALLHHKDLGVEVALQLLVCVVDAELLEGVDLKALEPKDVQYPDRPSALVLSLFRRPIHDSVTTEPPIDAAHHEVEDAFEHSARHSVASGCGLLDCVRRHDRLPGDAQASVAQTLAQNSAVDTQCAAHDGQRRERSASDSSGPATVTHKDVFPNIRI